MKKIHICFNMNEEERIYVAAKKNNPDTLYYFYFKDDYTQDKNLDQMEINIAKIRELLPNCEIIKRGVSYVNYKDVVDNIVRIIKEENGGFLKKKVKITVNGGTGSKLVSIALIDVYRLFGNIEIEYPYSTNYDSTRETGAHKGDIVNAQVPDFKFKMPSELIISSLQILNNLAQSNDEYNGISNIPLSLWRKAIFNAKLLQSSAEDDSKRVAQYQLMDRNIVKPLSDIWEYIKLKRVKKEKFVSLTGRGELVLPILLQFPQNVK